MNNSALIQRQGMLKKRLIKDLPKKKKRETRRKTDKRKNRQSGPKTANIFSMTKNLH